MLVFTLYLDIIIFTGLGEAPWRGTTRAREAECSSRAATVMKSCRNLRYAMLEQGLDSFAISQSSNRAFPQDRVVVDSSARTWWLVRNIAALVKHAPSGLCGFGLVPEMLCKKCGRLVMVDE